MLNPRTLRSEMEDTDLATVRTALLEGMVIPAHPLALDEQGHLDVQHQRALTRYYHAAGAGGIAVGVHSTQFEIREYGLLRPVLQLAAETVSACDAASGRRTILIAGISGPTGQALDEARLAHELGYDLGLLSLSALKGKGEEALIRHCQTVAQEIPLMGFYLQPAVGGIVLPYSFWRRFLEIPQVMAIKIAPFNRYQTLEVVRAVADSGRASEIALYTGNDDHILLDLLTEFVIPTAQDTVRLHFSGGLLGHWGCWTRTAVDLFLRCQEARHQGTIPRDLLSLAAQVTDCNAAFFDAAHHFAGAIPGILEVLRRQGLVSSTRCLDPSLTLSPGQAAEIERVHQAYPHLNDDAFVREHLEGWLA